MAVEFVAEVGEQSGQPVLVLPVLGLDQQRLLERDVLPEEVGLAGHGVDHQLLDMQH